MGKAKREILELDIESRDRPTILEALKDCLGCGKILLKGKDIIEEEEE